MIKVLAIDDDPSTTELLSLLLTPQGFHVIIANTGQEGLDAIRQKSPDVVILDLMIPIIDGWKLCDEARRFSRVPILVLSALDGPAMVASALDAGADDYLVKPVPSNVLVAHLNNLTRRAISKKRAPKTQAAPVSA